MRKIKRKLRILRHKAARLTLGLTVCERRIKHHKKRKQKFHRNVKLAAENGTTGWEGAYKGVTKAEWERKRKRAHTYLRRWQKRQTIWSRRHRYVKFIFKRWQRRKLKWLEDHPVTEFPEGLVTFDNHQVAGWIAEICAEARAAGYWVGEIFSGWRSKQYSKELCWGICGKDYCPGLCAGELTNHVGIYYPDGAIDATDSAGLIDFCRDRNKPLRGAGEVLSRDIPHCSHTGN